MAYIFAIILAVCGGIIMYVNRANIGGVFGASYEVSIEKMCIRDRYETGSRTPKADLTAALAEVLDVSPHALSVPDIDSYVGLMHTCLLYTSRCV